MAISKEQKKEILTQYVDLANRSQAMIVTEYRGLTMKQIDDLRSRVRENGGEFHIVKNTLGKLAIEQEGMPLPAGLLEGSTAICFAFTNAAAMAKTMTDFARTSEFLKIKGGYLEKQAISAEEVRSLAELPPLPVIRAQLLGTILSPASTLARTLAEPARQVAAVLQAFSDRENAHASA